MTLSDDSNAEYARPTQPQGGLPGALAACVMDVLVVAEQPVYRAGLVSLIQVDPALRCVGDAASLEGAEPRAAHARPHVVLLDLSSQHLDAEMAMLRLRNIQPAPRFVCLLERTGNSLARRVMAAGAYCVLPRSADLSDIGAAARGDFQGVHLQQPGQQERGKRAPYVPGDDLTDRELDVLQLVGCGMTNAEVSTRLGITRPTVKFHVTSVLEKMNASNRTEAVLNALRYGVISLEATHS